MLLGVAEPGAEDAFGRAPDLVAGPDVQGQQFVLHTDVGGRHAAAVETIFMTRRKPVDAK